ncbi:MAG: hypothetical protein SGILL_003892 [Bacillariaceae sp.]
MSSIAGIIAVLASAAGWTYYQEHGKPPVLATSIAVLAASWSLRKMFEKQRRKESKNGSRSVSDGNTTKRERLWSFTSQNLAQGSFPDTVSFGDPVINAVLMFPNAKECPKEQDILDQVVKVLLEYERFNSVFDPQTGVANPLEDLDPKDLVRTVEFNGSTEKDIMKVMEKHANEPLSDGLRGAVLPWWEFLILKNTNSKGECAVVWRVHHALGDGMSLVQVVQEIFFNANGEKLSDMVPPGMKKKFQMKRSPVAWILDFLKALATVLTIPSGPFDDMSAFSKKAPPKELTFPKKQEIYTFEAIPLEFVKRLKTAAGEGVTVNDILFTMLSQAIHDYLEEQDDPLLKEKGDKLTCRALLPVAMPRPKTLEKARTLRNIWCFISCDLSVGMDSVTDRLKSVHQSLSKLKKSLVPALTMGLQTYVLKYAPSWFNRDQVLQIFARHSMVFSNVPGPPDPVLFAGKEVMSVQMIHLNLIPQLGLLSYRGTIFGNICVAVDDGSHAMPHRERLPLFVSNALVLMASKLGVDDVPESVTKHAKMLK